MQNLEKVLEMLLDWDGLKMEDYISYLEEMKQIPMSVALRLVGIWFQHRNKFFDEKERCGPIELEVLEKMFEECVIKVRKRNGQRNVFLKEMELVI